jgi:hypothetical protein
MQPVESHRLAAATIAENHREAARLLVLLALALRVLLVSPSAVRSGLLRGNATAKLLRCRRCAASNTYRQL